MNLIILRLKRKGRRNTSVHDLCEVDSHEKEYRKLQKYNFKTEAKFSNLVAPNKYEEISFDALYEEGVFEPNKFNRYDGNNDYQFMLDMFNKRNKSEITEQQHRKIRSLMAYSIKPFLRKRLKYK